MKTDIFLNPKNKEEYNRGLNFYEHMMDLLIDKILALESQGYIVVQKYDRKVKSTTDPTITILQFSISPSTHFQLLVPTASTPLIAKLKKWIAEIERCRENVTHLLNQYGTFEDVNESASDYQDDYWSKRAQDNLEQDVIILRGKAIKWIEKIKMARHMKNIYARKIEAIQEMPGVLIADWDTPTKSWWFGGTKVDWRNSYMLGFALKSQHKYAFTSRDSVEGNVAYKRYLKVASDHSKAKKLEKTGLGQMTKINNKLKKLGATRIEVK